MDILAAVAEDQGFQYEVQVLGWDASIAACQAGQADGMIGGDSITDEAQIQSQNITYWKLLEEMLGINAVSYAVNGRQMNDLIRQGEELLKEHGQRVDAIIIMLGTNDFNASLPMGEFFTYERKETVRDGDRMELLHREPVICDSTFCGNCLLFNGVNC